MKEYKEYLKSEAEQPIQSNLPKLITPEHISLFEEEKYKLSTLIVNNMGFFATSTNDKTNQKYQEHVCFFLTNLLIDLNKIFFNTPPTKKNYEALNIFLNTIYNYNLTDLSKHFNQRILPIIKNSFVIMTFFIQNYNINMDKKIFNKELLDKKIKSPNAEHPNAEQLFPIIPRRNTPPEKSFIKDIIMNYTIIIDKRNLDNISIYKYYECIYQVTNSYDVKNKAFFNCGQFIRQFNINPENIVINQSFEIKYTDHIFIVPETAEMITKDLQSIQRIQLRGGVYKFNKNKINKFKTFKTKTNKTKSNKSKTFKTKTKPKPKTNKSKIIKTKTHSV